ncbi:enoyl-CoA hydratase [Streptococcus mutans]|nr:polyketide biosynthesis enoyl-CoA hydratase [Streptococcus mutans 4VF1]EMC34641.1 polyketide biosynthesis enoyl-CoA hydratase [Streptococcus mutans NLML1]NLQ71067.1 enoyl-CoA hydratase [Streptococcus mutans]NLR04605.1 enoyl-CoA hydratase [Streptococcus mutans]
MELTKVYKMEYRTLIVEKKNAILQITFNRTEARNSINCEFLQELNTALDYAKENLEIKIVLLQGKNGVFCSGMDFQEVASIKEKESSESSQKDLVMTQMYMDTLRRITLFSKVVISCVDGQVLAGGVGLVACSDLVIATSKAEFGLSEALWGLLPAMVLPYLIRKVGVQKAYFMTLTTIRISVEEAKDMNLVDEISNNMDHVILKYYQKISRMEEKTIENMKSYFRKLWIIDENMERMAVNQTYTLVSQPQVKENIYNFVTHKKFPWEKN